MDSSLLEWISKMDTSSVKDMGYIFAQSIGFNVDISAWDTSKVKNMSYIFSAARAFNQPIGARNTKKATNAYNRAQKKRKNRIRIDNI